MLISIRNSHWRKNRKETNFLLKVWYAVEMINHVLLLLLFKASHIEFDVSSLRVYCEGIIVTGWVKSIIQVWGNLQKTKRKHYVFSLSLSSVFLLNKLFSFQPRYVSLLCEIPKNEVKSAIQPRIAKMAKISANEQFLIVGYYTLPT